MSQSLIQGLQIGVSLLRMGAYIKGSDYFDYGL